MERGMPTLTIQHDGDRLDIDFSALGLYVDAAVAATVSVVHAIAGAQRATRELASPRCQLPDRWRMELTEYERQILAGLADVRHYQRLAAEAEARRQLDAEARQAAAAQEAAVQAGRIEQTARDRQAQQDAVRLRREEVAVRTEAILRERGCGQA